MYVLQENMQISFTWKFVNFFRFSFIYSDDEMCILKKVAKEYLIWNVAIHVLFMGYGRTSMASPNVVYFIHTTSPASSPTAKAQQSVYIYM